MNDQVVHAAICSSRLFPVLLQLLGGLELFERWTPAVCLPFEKEALIFQSILPNANVLFSHRVCTRDSVLFLARLGSSAASTSIPLDHILYLAVPCVHGSCRARVSDTLLRATKWSHEVIRSWYALSFWRLCQCILCLYYVKTGTESESTLWSSRLVDCPCWLCLYPSDLFYLRKDHGLCLVLDQEVMTSDIVIYILISVNTVSSEAYYQHSRNAYWMLTARDSSIFPSDLRVHSTNGDNIH